MKRNENVVLIDKPKGITSFGVIKILRKKYGIWEIGHAGTLDPLATGLLIVGVGGGTKKLAEFVKLPKVYEVDVLLGKKTATGDLEGEVLEENKVGEIDIEKIKEVLGGMVGKIILPVPVYSAVKVSGLPLYKKARKGEKVVPPEKEMEIFWIKLKNHFQENGYYVVGLELKVGSGTYIRSVAEEIGRRLNLPATVRELRRTMIGDFSVADAEKIT